MVLASHLEQVIEPETKDLGGFQARRVLPSDTRTMVGPFIFFDHLGPAVFPPGKGLDVRPHPHINLATLTYLFEGVILHRDSLGSVQEIHPGAVNWMTAGRGITHSERSPAWARPIESTLHGIQTWIALPDAHEETDPWFHHYAAAEMPSWETGGASIKLIAGQLGDRTSPVRTFSPILYLDVELADNAKFTLPALYSEQAVYAVTSGIALNRESMSVHTMALLKSGESVTLSTDQPARCIVIGGEPVGPRQKWWNFVSSRPERIEQAKRDWRDWKFPEVPEETEFIPLPDV
ncbi:pirin family protein [Thermoleptolyngbya oregonensis NK1-22]|uniref:Pirin family protein n=1 Tax=Thermoleptolyngbya oregonensis NK1-22 TaxID=2547457 RepID=A0AA96YSD5_9CYAN|nr:pirin family protein [Thermoleptolyngbya oregonensis]WOB45502.1 pirin family protein [Thermoleptolyngbya oregonensis NK1-22]